jgi:hypothetical protein
MIEREEYLKNLYKSHKKEIDTVILDAQSIKNDLKRASAMSDGKLRMFLGTIPGIIYHKLGQKYGYEVWDDEKFILSFFRVFNKFKITNRY